MKVAGERAGVRVGTIGPRDPGAEIEIVVVAVGLGLALALLALPLESIASLAGPCTFKLVTDVPCPTCGASRSIIALSDGRLVTALRLNPLLIGAVLAVFAYVPVAFVLWTRGLRRPRLRLVHPGARWGAVAVALAAVAVNWVFIVVDGR